MAAAADPTALLAQLQDPQTSKPLSILHLAEPILESEASAANHPSSDSAAAQRDLATSTTSAPDTTSVVLTPSTLGADLQHYRDLFSKLRFSYLEQVTKEKYLRSIVGDPPLLVTPKDNAELEAKLVGMKAELKAKKAETDALVTELEGVAAALAAQYEGVESGKVALRALPAEVEDLKAQVAVLREEVQRKQTELGREGDEDPRYAMRMDATAQALEEQRRANEAIDREIAELERRLPGKMRECERAERELEEMERQREEITRQAREVKRIREEGGRDLVGERGRWYTAQEAVLKGLLRT
ncbi:uncharacterized protein HMPREF1541_00608 [Cyphellophora europaea CBS 101466]|uniref:Kinetochore protein Sos7 coiled-coil domain-containing protein n=1 Tax=Cyphellophora europaea (strain CBS 101466) TaxID=1220924 RepID=W2SEW5_CYPE1|nr:uncharacterized protein HMPREF1541_00608 [Cyphellophora europaea CBS 101466]ETN46424.1 hypothetical protein HMPREF1541_00608 [Cyphellophora europaea CBS 101466]